MNFYKIGKIVNTHGLRGDLKVLPITDFPEERFQPGNHLYIATSDNSPFEVIVNQVRVQKGMLIINFKDLADINLVEQYKGLNLLVSEQDQGKLADDEFYYHEIIGLTVQTGDGEKIGTIKEIMAPGANDVWVVQRPGKPDLLLPYIDDVVKNVDLANQVVTVELMEGLE